MRCCNASKLFKRCTPEAGTFDRRPRAVQLGLARFLQPFELHRVILFMGARLQRYARGTAIALCAIGLAWVGALVALPEISPLFSFGRGRVLLVQVKGIRLLPEGDRLVVYTDQGEFTAATHSIAGQRREDPLFMFHLGEKYRVRIRDNSPTVGPPARPLISEVESVAPSSYVEAQ
jgi:hypothetical protein